LKSISHEITSRFCWPNGAHNKENQLQNFYTLTVVNIKRGSFELYILSLSVRRDSLGTVATQLVVPRARLSFATGPIRDSVACKILASVRPWPSPPASISSLSGTFLLIIPRRSQKVEAALLGGRTPNDVSPVILWKAFEIAGLLSAT
jgi:hypothetical protein